MFRYHLFLIVFALVQATGATADETASMGRDLFVQYCTDCHGTNASSTAASGNPKSDLTKISERRGGVWPMLEVMSIIDGYTRPRSENAQMPVFDALSEGPLLDFDTGNGDVIAVAERLVALARYLESIQSPRPERFVP